MKPPNQTIQISLACWMLLVALTFFNVSLPVDRADVDSFQAEKTLVEGEWMLCVPSQLQTSDEASLTVPTR